MSSSEFSPYTRTVEMPANIETPENLDQTQARPRHPLMALVEGTRLKLSGEIDHVLQIRLRLASLLLFTGYLSFFIKNLFLLHRFVTWFDWLLFGYHFAITALTGIIGLRLCMKCRHMVGHLRIIEFLVF
ncbi:MAG: hypothetical protein KDA84_20705, partial [Planctomycetaceae bacterium]|nr:hypothetical protein [Planctomycetaceae bacterium]